LFVAGKRRTSASLLRGTMASGMPSALGLQKCQPGRQVICLAGGLEDAVRTWLAQPGPALLHVKVNPMRLVMPPTPFVEPGAVIGMAVYTAKAMLHGKGNDVWEMIVENIT
jgi:thiamine pyrophosphate-dependent acetolactate synthase large subunit-like protein